MKLMMFLMLMTVTWAVDLDNIPDNTWIKLDGVTREFPAGYTGDFSRRFWCTFTWDQDSGRILFYEGYNGSHNQAGSSIYANAVYSLTPADEKVCFVNLSTYWDNPTWDTYVTGSGPETPHPRHTYGAFKYVSKYKNIYMAFGACAHTASCDATNLWKYHVPTDTWTKITTPLPDAEIGGYDANFAYLPGSDTLWVFTQNSGTWINLYAFNMADETWTQKINYGVRTYGSRHAAEDTLRRCVLYLSATGYHFLDPAAGSLVKFADTSDGLPANAVMTYIPKYDRYFIYSSGKKEVWTLNPADTTWTRIASNNDPGKRIDRYIAYDPMNDVVATFNVDGEFYVFRYKPEVSSASRPAPQTVMTGFTTSPNPARNTVRITVKGASSLSVFNCSGKRVADLHHHAGTALWNAGNLPSGVYIVRAEAGGHLLKKAVTVIR